jgi:hypothetical protein
VQPDTHDTWRCPHGDTTATRSNASDPIPQCQVHLVQMGRAPDQTVEG